jgi:hypothetical protein
LVASRHSEKLYFDLICYRIRGQQRQMSESRGIYRMLAD